MPTQWNPNVSTDLRLVWLIGLFFAVVFVPLVVWLWGHSRGRTKAFKEANDVWQKKMDHFLIWSLAQDPFNDKVPGAWERYLRAAHAAGLVPDDDLGDLKTAAEQVGDKILEQAKKRMSKAGKRYPNVMEAQVTNELVTRMPMGNNLQVIALCLLEYIQKNPGAKGLDAVTAVYDSARGGKAIGDAVARLMKGIVVTERERGSISGSDNGGWTLTEKGEQAIAQLREQVRSERDHGRSEGKRAVDAAVDEAAEQPNPDQFVQSEAMRQFITTMTDLVGRLEQLKNAPKKQPEGPGIDPKLSLKAEVLKQFKELQTPGGNNYVNVALVWERLGGVLSLDQIREVCRDLAREGKLMDIGGDLFGLAKESHLTTLQGHILSVFRAAGEIDNQNVEWIQAALTGRGIDAWVGEITNACKALVASGLMVEPVPGLFNQSEMWNAFQKDKGGVVAQQDDDAAKAEARAAVAAGRMSEHAYQHRFNESSGVLSPTQSRADAANWPRNYMVQPPPEEGDDEADLDNAPSAPVDFSKTVGPEGRVQPVPNVLVAVKDGILRVWHSGGPVNVCVADLDAPGSDPNVLPAEMYRMLSDLSSDRALPLSSFNADTEWLDLALGVLQEYVEHGDDGTLRAHVDEAANHLLNALPVERRMLTYQATLKGFDGSTDDTDHLVKWINAPGESVVRRFLKAHQLELENEHELYLIVPTTIAGGVDVVLNARGQVVRGEIGRVDPPAGGVTTRQAPTEHVGPTEPPAYEAGNVESESGGSDTATDMAIHENEVRREATGHNPLEDVT